MGESGPAPLAPDDRSDEPTDTEESGETSFSDRTGTRGSDAHDLVLSPHSNKRHSAGRHSAREVALQVLYAIDLGPHPSTAAPLDDPLDSNVTETSSEPLEADRGRKPGESSEDPSTRTANAFDRVVENFVVPAAAAAFARELVESVAGSRAGLDQLLGQHARNWRVSRMAAVDRNVLRIGVYELRDTQTPVAVVIDEAVDLARRFGSDASPAFVNGILDAVAREVRSS